MTAKLLKAFTFTAALWQVASAQACNNSPSLCDRSYGNITYLGAHDSPFLRDASTDYSTSGNQYYNTTTQLAAGVRLVTAQVQYPNGTNDLHVCHTDCQLLDAGPLSDWLSEVKTWMDSNPHDVVTILLVNGAGASASQLAAAYSSSGLKQYAYTPTTSTVTLQWPTLNSLISQGTRAINFVATLDDNADAPFLMNEFEHVFENNYDNSAPSDFSCEVNRPDSLVGQTSAAISDGYLSLVNHFLYEDQLFGIQSPNATYAGTTNAPSQGLGTLGSAGALCASQYGQAPNFLLVDFFNRGPAIQVADTLNGVSNPTGRTSVPDSAPNESAASAAISKVSTWSICGSVALLALALM